MRRRVVVMTAPMLKGPAVALGPHPGAEAHSHGAKRAGPSRGICPTAMGQSVSQPGGRWFRVSVRFAVGPRHHAVRPIASATPPIATRSARATESAYRWNCS